MANLAWYDFVDEEQQIAAEIIIMPKSYPGTGFQVIRFQRLHQPLTHAARVVAISVPVAPHPNQAPVPAHGLGGGIAGVVG